MKLLTTCFAPSGHTGSEKNRENNREKCKMACLRMRFLIILIHVSAFASNPSVNLHMSFCWFPVLVGSDGVVKGRKIKIARFRGGGAGSSFI